MEEVDKTVRFTFNKSEKLSCKKDIQILFKSGISFYIHPFKVIVHTTTRVEPHQVLFTVPKRNFKKAVDRNLLKRRMREAYRLHKDLLQVSPKVLNIAYIYTSKKIIKYAPITTQLKQSLRLIKKYVEKESK